MYNKNLAKNIKEVLREIGENPEREGLLKTPERVAKSLDFLTNGYDLNPSDILNKAMFKEQYSQMVLVKDIELYSLCEHHLVPFFGKAHIAYIPNGKIVGLSKIPRVVDIFSRRLQVQERLTTQIYNELKDVLNTDSVMVVIEAKHLCVSSRGIKDYSSSTITEMYGGDFNIYNKRDEFYKLLNSVKI